MSCPCYRNKQTPTWFKPRVKIVPKKPGFKPRCNFTQLKPRFKPGWVQRAEACGAQVRAQRASKRTADRRLSENLSEETRDAQRQRLEENVGDMSAEARERQQSANEKRKSTNRMTARCGECGEHKISDEYTRRQWQDRKKRTPTCRKCRMIAEAQSKSQQRPLRRSRRAQ